MIDFRRLTAERRAATFRITQPPAVPEALARAVERVTREKLSDEQARVFDAVKAGHNVLVTGPAGTGKSFLLKAFLEEFAGRLPVTASTGIAAVAVGGVTVHSWGGLGLAEDTAEKIAKRIMDEGGKGYLNITKFNRLAIDEISMISAGLFTKLDKIFRIVRRVDEPFGGMKLILFGDFLQLPPVIKGEEAQSGQTFCFESPSWTAAKFKTAVLTKIFRQADEEFATALNSIRVGDYTPLVSKVLRSCYRRKDLTPEIEPVTVHTHNANVDEINAHRLASIEKPAKVYRAVDEGRESSVKFLQKNCIAPEVLELKESAQVMLLCNADQARGLANGSVGIVTGFAAGESRPIVRFANGEVLEVEHHEWEVKENGRVLATRRQIPLRLAYAITAHKSQGMSLDKIRVYLAKCFEYGQAYVALSRAKTMEGLFIESGSRDSIRAHPKAVAFYAEADRV